MANEDPYREAKEMFDKHGIEYMEADGRIHATLGPWQVTRNMRKGYWEAEAPWGSDQGIPLDIAIELHERPYEGRHLGELVRVHRYAGGKDPREAALPKIEPERDYGKKSIAQIGEEAREAGEPTFISSYHINGLGPLEIWIKTAIPLYR